MLKPVIVIVAAFLWLLPMPRLLAPALFAQVKTDSILIAKEKNLFQLGFPSFQKSVVTYSPDGRFLAGAANRSGFLMVWDCDTGQVKTRLVYDNCNISKLQFSPDGRYLAASVAEISTKPGGKYWRKVIDVASGREEPAIKVTQSLVFYEGKKEVAITEPPFVKWLDTKYDKVVREFQYSNRLSTFPSLSPDQKMLAVKVLPDRIIELWSVDSEKKTFTLQGIEKNVQAMMFSASNKWFACASTDNKLSKHVCIWNPKNGELIHKIPFAGIPNAMAFSRDEKWVAVAAGKDVSIFDVATGKLALTLNPSEKIGVTWSVVFNPEARQVAATNGRYVQVWELSAKKAAKP